MAGINGFGNVNLGGVNQIGAAKGTQQTKLETESLLQKNDQLDGFVKSNDVEQTKKEDDKPKINEGGDGEKKSYGHFFNKRMGDRTGDGEDLIKRCDADPEGAGAAAPIAALLALWDWLTQ